MTSRTGRLQAIAEEVIVILNVKDIFSFMDGETGNVRALEERLQQVMQTRQSLECIELAMYLRTSASRQGYLPTWQPLLNAALEMCQQRSEDQIMFYGLMPDRPHPIRNTEGVTGSRHPQLQKR